MSGAHQRHGHRMSRRTERRIFRLLVACEGFGRSRPESVSVRKRTRRRALVPAGRPAEVNGQLSWITVIVSPLVTVNRRPGSSTGILAGPENAFPQRIELSARPVSRPGNSASSSPVTASYIRGHWYNARTLRPKGQQILGRLCQLPGPDETLLRRRPAGQHARPETAGFISVRHFGGGAHVLSGVSHRQSGAVARLAACR
jgi:hypothetical protein